MFASLEPSANAAGNNYEINKGERADGLLVGLPFSNCARGDNTAGRG